MNRDSTLFVWCLAALLGVLTYIEIRRIMTGPAVAVVTPGNRPDTAPAAEEKQRHDPAPETGVGPRPVRYAFLPPVNGYLPRVVKGNPAQIVLSGCNDE